MAIKLVDNVTNFPKNRYTMAEVLAEFEKLLPKDLLDANISNAVIVYKTDDGFSHSVLDLGDIIPLVGAVEAWKHHLLYGYIASGEIVYSDDGDDE